MPDRRTPPAVYPFAPMTMPGETVERLDNGLTFHRFSGGDQPVCNLTLHLTGGVSEMGEAAAKVLASQLSEGTAGRSADEISEALDDSGARLSCQSQAHHTTVKISLLTSRLPDILPVLSDMITEPSFPDDRLDVARQRLVTALHVSLEDPQAVADIRLQPLVWGRDNPLAHEMTEADIREVSAGTLRSLHRRLVCPARMHAYLSGLLDRDSIRATRDFLGNIPVLSSGYDIELHPAMPEPGGSMVVTDMPSAMQCAIACSIAAPGREHPDYVPLRFAVMALGGYFGSRLMSNIREEKGLSYGISAALMGSQDGAQVYIGTTTDRSTSDMVLDEIKHELTEMAVNPPAGEELERFRTYAMTGLAEQLDNPISVMQYYGSQNIVGTPSDYFERQQAILQSLTPDDIARTSAKYLNPTKLLISRTS
ncbi:MAG: insulinase family protein [Muribaculaceae bacterium]|nr:insulinase family protein [Muribaculaceae bacterium]